jgi:capsular polysaccharide biosynthesis protein
MIPAAFQKIRSNINRMLPAHVRRGLKRILYGLPPICPQVRAWAEATGKAEIVKIYWETHQRSRPLPPLCDDAMPQVFLKNQTYPVYDRVLYRIPNVKIRGKSGILTLPGGSVCHQTAWSYDHITGSPDYATRWRGPVVAKPGNYSTLIFYWGLGYYHWYNDVLSTLFENIELLPSDTRFIIPSDIEPHHLTALDLLGIGPNRWIIFDGSEVWKLENLWFQPPAVHPDDQTPGAMSWLGRTLSAAVATEATEKPLRLFISRRHARTRTVANEEELLPILDRHGFTPISTENLSLPDQIRLFRSAEAVIAPHGAGLTNLIYSPPGTSVLELFSTDTIRRCYWTLSHELGHPYRFLIGDPIIGRGHEPDIRVDPTRLIAHLESMLAPPRSSRRP